MGIPASEVDVTSESQAHTFIEEVEDISPDSWSDELDKAINNFANSFEESIDAEKMVEIMKETY